MFIPDPTDPTVTYDPLAIREVAAIEACDPRSIVRRLRGKSVRGIAGVRVDRAIARLRLRQHNNGGHAPSAA